MGKNLSRHEKRVKVLVPQECPTLCSLMDCNSPGSSVYEIFQARILELVAISFSRAFSQPRDQTQVPYSAGGSFTVWATREALSLSPWVVSCGSLIVDCPRVFSLDLFSSLSTQQPPTTSSLNHLWIQPPPLEMLVPSHLPHGRVVLLPSQGSRWPCPRLLTRVKGQNV